MKIRRLKRLFWQRFAWMDGELWTKPDKYGLQFNSCGTQLPGRVIDKKGKQQ